MRINLTLFIHCFTASLYVKVYQKVDNMSYTTPQVDVRRASDSSTPMQSLNGSESNNSTLRINVPPEMSRSFQGDIKIELIKKNIKLIKVVSMLKIYSYI